VSIMTAAFRQGARIQHSVFPGWEGKACFRTSANARRSGRAGLEEERRLAPCRRSRARRPAPPKIYFCHQPAHAWMWTSTSRRASRRAARGRPSSDGVQGRFRRLGYPAASRSMRAVELRHARLGLELVGLDHRARGLGERDAPLARVIVQHLHGGVAQPALGHVDDALEGEIVGGRMHDPQIGERVADFPGARRSAARRSRDRAGRE